MTLPIAFEPAHRLAHRLRERQLSSVELLQHFAERVDRFNPQLNAIIAQDFETARERAREADAALSRKDARGPLLGLPITIKDSIEVAGLPTVCGAPALKDHRPREHAPAAQRLLDAGAIVFGKTNVPFFAQDVQTFNKVFGTTRNPWDANHTCGGSSGGSAAAVAAGLTALEMGSDIAGSIRIPAHFCGIYGHKPTLGLVPTRGHIPGPPGTVSQSDLAVIGPLARDPDDLELALQRIAGPLPPADRAIQLRLPTPRPQRLQDYRVKVWLGDPFCEIDRGYLAALHVTVDALRKAGCRVDEGRPADLSLAELFDVYFKLLAATLGGAIPQKQFSRAVLAAALAKRLGRALPNTRQGFLHGATRSHRQWLRTNERRERIALRLEGFFQDYDVLLMPVTPSAAPIHNTQGSPYERTIPVNGRNQPYANQFVWNGPATMAGLPATVAPIGCTAAGLPVGVQIVGAQYNDLTTIDFARQLRDLVGGFQPPPQYITA